MVKHVSLSHIQPQPLSNMDIDLEKSQKIRNLNFCSISLLKFHSVTVTIGFVPTISSYITGELIERTSWRQFLWTEQTDTVRLDIVLTAPGRKRFSG